jgi:hypothetical protein
MKNLSSIPKQFCNQDIVVVAPWLQSLQKLCCTASYDLGNVHLVATMTEEAQVKLTRAGAEAYVCVVKFVVASISDQHYV